MFSLLQKAPEFRAPAVVGQGDFAEVSLADYRGKYVVLVFYPLDFTFVCPTEIMEFGRRHSEFKELGAEVIGISCDSQYSHKAWLEHSLGSLPFPLVADYTKSISAAYGTLLPAGFPARATFIVDPEGDIQHASFNNPNVGRSVTEVLRVLEAVRSGEKTPADWKKGQPTLG
ncbi:MAG: peroxiredoxin [Deltaproteobacteria bacterium]|nr:peroxiredoxin [Deltaproteobacteria bacterium]